MMKCQVSYLLAPEMTNDKCLAILEIERALLFVANERRS